MKKLSVIILTISVVFCTACSADKDSSLAAIRTKTPKCCEVKKIGRYNLDSEFYVSSDSTGKIFLWRVDCNGKIVALQPK
jgi:hypothetical protein